VGPREEAPRVVKVAQVVKVVKVDHQGDKVNSRVVARVKKALGGLEVHRLVAISCRIKPLRGFWLPLSAA
jgi:hypothetical protein